MDDGELLERLREALGPDGLSVDHETRVAQSADIAGEDRVAAAVAWPTTLAALQATVAASVGAGYAMVPRGSGHSYSGGVVPTHERSVVVDLSRLDRVLEIDPVNRFVRVEAGCTWAALFDALAPHGLRTPFFGPLSGHRSTVGGALSQRATFFGSAMHGSSEDSVIGLTVVLAGGELLRTGVGADGRPHPRASGPDLGGLFLGDCGAFGIKAEATLRLVERPAAEAFASFGFPDMYALLQVQAAVVGMAGIAECFGFDPQAHANLARGGFEMLEGAQIAADVVRQKGSALTRLSRLTQLVREGRRSVADLRYSLHVCLEADGEQHATARLAAVSAVALDAGGEALPDTIPRVTRSRPFRPIKALLGPAGERWLPLHGVFRISDAEEGYRALETVLARQKAPSEVHGLKVSLLTVTSGDAIVIEPHLFWPDSLTPFHRRNVTEAQLTRYRQSPARPEARAFALELRLELGEALRQAGAEHMQIGRYYPYEKQLDPVQRRLVKGLKSLLDPEGLMAPGSLIASLRFSEIAGKER